MRRSLVGVFLLVLLAPDELLLDTLAIDAELDVPPAIERTEERFLRHDKPSELPGEPKGLPQSLGTGIPGGCCNFLLQNR